MSRWRSLGLVAMVAWFALGAGSPVRAQNVIEPPPAGATSSTTTSTTPSTPLWQSLLGLGIAAL